MILTFILSLLLAALPAAAQPKRPSCAVGQLQALRVDSMDVSILTEALTSSLLSTGKLRMLERSQMENILKEQGFQQSGACDASECAVEIGKLLSVDHIVVGSIGHIGSSFVISMRMVDVGTGEIRTSTSRSVQGSIDQVLLQAIPDIARELVGLPTDAPVATVRRTPSASTQPSSRGFKGWMGFAFTRPGSFLEQTSRTLNGIQDTGVAVLRVGEGSPAERAGIQPGDIILSYNGYTVLGVSEFEKAVAQLVPGETVEFVILREGKRLVVPAVIGAKAY